MSVSLKQLESAVKKSFSCETCHFKFLWDDKSLPLSAGHCRVVSLIVQDYFGGEIVYSYVKGNRKWDHYWNKFPSGKEIDLTFDQFPNGVYFVKPVVLSREKVLSSKITQRGYKILKRRVKKILRV